MVFSADVWRVAIPLLGLAADISAHIFCFRLMRSLGMLRAVVVGFVTGAAAVLALVILWRDVSGFGILDVLTYMLLGYGYFHFVNLGETSRRVRILRELEETGGLLPAELLQRYNSGEIFERRIGRLLHNGQVVERGGLYFVGRPIVLWMARALVFLKVLLIGYSDETGACSKEL